MKTLYRIIKPLVMERMECERIGGKFVHIYEDEFMCRTDRFWYGKVAGKFIFSLGDIEVESDWSPVSTYVFEERAVFIRSGKLSVGVFPDRVYVERDRVRVRYTIKQ